MDFKDLETNLDEWQVALAKRGSEYKDLLNKIIVQRKKCLEISTQLESMRGDKKSAAKNKDIEQGTLHKARIKNIKAKYDDCERQLLAWVNLLPNKPLGNIPSGGEENNQVLDTVGKPPKIDKPKDHIELGKQLDIIDIERAAKTSGSRFYFLKNQAVELEFALVRWVMDLLKEKGFGLMVPPVMVNEEVMSAGGYLGKNENEIYRTQDNLYLIGTSEQSMLGYHATEIIDVPKRYASFSTCFRREAGSYGQDVKGIIRTHQFDKVEMFSFVDPKTSDKELDLIVGIQEEILKYLEVPYQRVLLAAGDMSACSAKTIDLESWLPSQKRYRETHSASNCTNWQAHRAGIVFKKNGKSAGRVHTLNGTAIAIGRMLVVLLENHQQPDGSIKIPKVLHPYLSFTEIK